MIRKTITEQIEVMKEFDNGEKVYCKRIEVGAPVNWIRTRNPIWNWHDFDYDSQIPTSRTCLNCQHEDLSFDSVPCIGCSEGSKFVKKKQEPEMRCSDCQYARVLAHIEPCKTCTKHQGFVSKYKRSTVSWSLPYPNSTRNPLCQADMENYHWILKKDSTVWCKILRVGEKSVTFSGNRRVHSEITKTYRELMYDGYARSIDGKTWAKCYKTIY